MRPDSAAFLWDVHAAATRIAEFIEGLDSQRYEADDLRRSAVERQLEIGGEALKNLRNADPSAADQIRDIAHIIGLRNILAHGYTVVDDTVVWQPHRSVYPSCYSWSTAFSPTESPTWGAIDSPTSGPHLKQIDMIHS